MGRPVTTSPCVSLSSSSGTSILSLVTWPWEEDDREKDHGDSRCVPFFPFFLLLSSYTYFISKDGMMKLWRRRRKKGKKHRDQIFFWREVNVFYNQSIIKIKRNGLFIEDYVYSSLSTKKIWVHLRRWTEKPTRKGKRRRNRQTIASSKMKTAKLLDFLFLDFSDFVFVFYLSWWVFPPGDSYLLSRVFLCQPSTSWSLVEEWLTEDQR